MKKARLIDRPRLMVGMSGLGLCLLMFGGATCPSDGGAAGAGLPVPGEYFYFPNPTDPLLLQATTESGGLLEVYGEKDDAGLPTAINRMRYQRSDQTDDGAGVWIDVDDQGRTTQLTGDDGSIITLDWQSETVALVTAVDGTGVVQTNFELDFDQGGSGRKRNVDVIEGYSRIGQPAEFEVFSPEELGVAPPASTNGKAQASAKDRSNVVEVNVTRCGQTVKGANVFVAFSYPNEPTSQVALAKSVGPVGHYEATVPTVWTPNEIELNKACSFFADNLGKLCTGLGLTPAGTDTLLCAELAIKIDLVIAGPTGEGAGIFALCQLGAEAVKVYCSTLNASPAPGVPINAAGEICAKIKELEDRAPPDMSVQYEMYAWAELPGVPKVQSEKRFVSAVGDFPSIDLSFEDGAAAINSFTTSPANPDPYQSYRATAELSCMPAGVTVRISVVGSDDFTTSNDLVVEADNPNPIITLNVPGGAAEVKDTITVEVVNGIPMITPPFSASVTELKREIRIEF